MVDFLSAPIPIWMIPVSVLVFAVGFFAIVATIKVENHEDDPPHP